MLGVVKVSMLVLVALYFSHTLPAEAHLAEMMTPPLAHGNGRRNMPWA